jgi:transcriptional regulator with XRE-family HTH domain
VKPSAIVALRKRLGKTQAQLAEMLAVDPVTISRWEIGQRRPRPVYIRELKRLRHEAT